MPASSRCVAKLCRSVWHAARLPMPLARTACAIARCSADSCRWCRRHCPVSRFRYRMITHDLSRVPITGQRRVTYGSSGGPFGIVVSKARMAISQLGIGVSKLRLAVSNIGFGMSKLRNGPSKLRSAISNVRNGISKLGNARSELRKRRSKLRNGVSRFRPDQPESRAARPKRRAGHSK